MGIQIKAGNWGQETWNTRQDVQEASDYARAITAVQERTASTGLGGQLYRDYRRYRATGARSFLPVVALTQGFWASAVFRVSHWLVKHVRMRGLRLLVRIPSLLLEKFIEIVTGISISAQCNIGPGLYIGHFGGIFVDSRCVLGENCNLAQGVTIGEGGRGELHGVPVIGDRVHIGVNAVILGRITVGDDAVIGPGAVVMSSVPACGVAMGNPARVVGLSGSFEFINYDDKENDPSRKAALERQVCEMSAG